MRRFVSTATRRGKKIYMFPINVFDLKEIFKI